MGSRSGLSSRGGLGSRGGLSRGGLESRGSFDGQVVGDSRDGGFSTAVGVSDWEANFEVGSFAHKSQELSFREEASYFSSFCSFGGKRVRGEPLFGGTDSAMAADMEIAFPLPRNEAHGPTAQVSATRPPRATPGTVLLEFTEPTHGVFRSALPECDTGQNADVCRVSGRPMCKGSTYISPVSPLLAGLQTLENQKNPERVQSPAISCLLRESASREASRMTLSTASFPSRPGTSTDKPLTAASGFTSCDSEATSCWNVPDYFLPFIAPKDISSKDAPRRRTCKVPDPALLPKCASAPTLNRVYGPFAADLRRDLKDLRRGGTTAEGTGANRDVTPTELCMFDCNDTPESLANGIEILKNAMVKAREHGAACHPTMSLSEGFLKVVERKHKLLAPLCKQMEGYGEVVKDVQSLVDTVLAGAEPEALWGHVFGMREIIENGIHMPYPGAGDSKGRPQDADKTIRHSEGFQKRFGLNGRHKAILRAREFFKGPAAECAVICAKKAKEIVLEAAARQDLNPRSTEADAVSRMEALLEGLGTNPDHAAMTEVGRCKEAARAAAVLRFAQSKFPAPVGGQDKAYQAAMRVEEEVQAAYEFGVFEDHPDIMKAAAVGHHLRSEGVLRFAKQRLKTMGNRLGDAEEAAIKIENAIKDATKLGVPVSTEELEEARKVALKAREAEGLKRREANAAARKAEKEAAANAAK